MVTYVRKSGVMLLVAILLAGTLSIGALPSLSEYNTVHALSNNTPKIVYTLNCDKVMDHVQAKTGAKTTITAVITNAGHKAQISVSPQSKPNSWRGFKREFLPGLPPILVAFVSTKPINPGNWANWAC